MAGTKDVLDDLKQAQKILRRCLGYLTDLQDEINGRMALRFEGDLGDFEKRLDSAHTKLIECHKLVDKLRERKEN